jgi:hypothetical protein
MINSWVRYGLYTLRAAATTGAVRFTDDCASGEKIVITSESGG